MEMASKLMLTLLVFCENFFALCKFESLLGWKLVEYRIRESRLGLKK
ncbi:hypothetical protein DFP97_117142 [Paenibacillus prosopidis]|uniref:Uncharacterized protein n=1 Tax=Paenibacillus prosopidis TaxID=630520 RepID=A0A368VLL0_9BACL|nr:hypothetical protein DFP97_117142 [Paenibacillus prosopidis]